MNAVEMDRRLLQLEGQMNAMARAWLYLVSNIEMHCDIDMEKMEAAMLTTRWPGSPDIDTEACAAVRWLCNELDDARAVRKAQRQGCYRKRH